MSDRALNELLNDVPGLVAAYVFGSRARGDASEKSDLDIAVWLQQQPVTFDAAPLDLAGDIERALGVPVDVVILNGAPSDLVHRVLRDGILVLERDRSARVKLEVRARNDYFDLLPIRTAYRRGSSRVGKS